MLGEPRRAGGIHSPAPGVVGEVDLHAHIERRAVGVGGVQGVGEAVAVDGVHGIGCRAHGPRLLRLHLADEVPAHPVEDVPAAGTGGELGSLRGEFLLPVLADVAHAECGEVGDQLRGVELRDDDPREGPRVTARRPRGICDARVDVGEPFRQGGSRVGRRGHFRKSGMSRSSAP